MLQVEPRNDSLPRKAAFIVAIVAAVAFVGWLDVATGLKPDLTVLYLVPIVAATIEFGLAAGVTVALVAAVVEIIARPGGASISTVSLVADALTHLAVFVIAAAGVSRLLGQLRRIRQLEARRDFDLDLARDVHADYLQPRTTGGPDVAIGFRLAFAFELGGDYFDAADTGRGLFFAIGDISGKGTAAALFTVALHEQVLDALATDPSPANVVRQVNETMYRLTPPQMFVTLFCGLVDGGALEYVNAGHEPPLLLTPDAADPVSLESESVVPVGIQPQLAAEPSRVAFPAGAVLLAVTDGVTESPRLEPDSRERLARMLVSERDASAQDIADAVFTAAAPSHGEPQADDIIVVCLRRTPGE